MRDLCSFDYSVVRVVPRVERGEFVNAGIVLYCATRGHLACRMDPDWGRLTALDSGIDRATVEAHLDAISRICRGGAEAGPIGALGQGARFHWLVAPRSTILQMSPVHSGVHHDLDDAMEQLVRKLVLTDRTS